MHAALATTKWLRRAVTIPGLVVLCVVDLVALPVLLAVELAVDLAKRRRLAGVRFQLAVAFALVIHALGLVVLFGTWLAGIFEGRARERELDVESEVWWATATWRAAMRLYGIRVIIEHDEELEPGPIVLMSRHASLLDILLPVVVASARHGLVLRYVAKRELLWDPCIDVFGSRLPIAFIRRQSKDHDVEIAAVESLAEHLGSHDGVVIFPEGTRFSPAKRSHIVEKLALHHDPASAYAAGLKHLLPPHAGGPLGLLEHAHGADVVFCAHSGLEGANHLRDLLAGSLIHATVRVRYWRAPAREVPTNADERLRWLREWWKRLDDWIDAEPHAAASQ